MTNELFAEASAVWKMLDEMAVNDPVGYKKFINKQLEDGQKALAPPKVKFVIKATLKVRRRSLMINYCEWGAVPDAKSEGSPIIVKCGELFEVDGGSAIAMAFNPNVFVRHAFATDSGPTDPPIIPHASSRQEEDARYQLIWLGLHYLEVEKKLCTVESNSVICSSAPLRPKFLPPDARYGTTSQIVQSLGYARPMLNAEGAPEGSRMSSPLDGATWKFVGDREIQLRHLTNPANHQGLLFTEKEPFLLSHKASPQKNVESKLIEEVDTQEIKTGEIKFASERIAWHAEVMSAAKTDGPNQRPNQLKITFDLPGVTSGSQCDLDVTEVSPWKSDDYASNFG
ncbi:unnamed protein product [Dicrocoelium dendriticum]|nr:unnamed protein product [Dicrocoelium dendriticum]